MYCTPSRTPSPADAIPPPHTIQWLRKFAILIMLAIFAISTASICDGTQQPKLTPIFACPIQQIRLPHISPFSGYSTRDIRQYNHIHPLLFTRPLWINPKQPLYGYYCNKLHKIGVHMKRKPVLVINLLKTNLPIAPIGMSLPVLTMYQIPGFETFFNNIASSF